jgi:hypothetical protein
MSALYDKAYRADVPAHAYACGKANGGAAGVDGQSFADIESYGRERWIGDLAEPTGRSMPTSGSMSPGAPGRFQESTSPRNVLE